ncbi:hypothetical protein Nmel_010058, partial [Mimus melanotis]
VPTTYHFHFAERLSSSPGSELCVFLVFYPKENGLAVEEQRRECFTKMDFSPPGSRSITLLGQCNVSEPEIPVTMRQKSYSGVSGGELDSVCQKQPDNTELPSWKRVSRLMENHRVLFQKGSAVYFWKKEGVTNNSHFSWQGDRRVGRRAVFGMSNSPAALGPLSCSSEAGRRGHHSSAPPGTLPWKVWLWNCW